MVHDGCNQRGRRGVDAAHLAQELVVEVRLAHLMGYVSRALLIGVSLGIGAGAIYLVYGLMCSWLTFCGPGERPSDG